MATCAILVKGSVCYQNWYPSNHPWSILVHLLPNAISEQNYITIQIQYSTKIPDASRPSPPYFGTRRKIVNGKNGQNKTKQALPVSPQLAGVSGRVSCFGYFSFCGQAVFPLLYLSAFHCWNCTSHFSQIGAKRPKRLENKPYFCCALDDGERHQTTESTYCNPQHN